MNTHNICFHGEIRKMSVLFHQKKKKNRLIRSYVVYVFTSNNWSLSPFSGLGSYGKDIVHICCFSGFIILLLSLTQQIC